MRFLILVLVAILVVGAEIVWTGAAASSWAQRQETLNNPRRQLELRIATADLALHRLDMPGNGLSGAVLRLARADLDHGTLLLRNETDSRGYLYVDADGFLHRNGKVVRHLQRELSVYANDQEIALVCDREVAARFDAKQWQTYLVGPTTLTPPKPQLPPRVSIRDGFMREQFLDDNWRVLAGNWSLHQRGGGLPTDEREEESYNFQRAVNPFSLFGERHAVATLGSEPLPNGAIAANFYFGKPKTGNVSDVQTVPLDSSMLLTVGSAEQPEYAFGWHGPSAAFCLLQRQTDGGWQINQRIRSDRPPISNWFKLELQLHNASTITGILDGEAIVQLPLTAPVDGIFGIASGEQLIELDDVELASLPRPIANKGTPILVKSRNFAAKRIKDGRDPIQFHQWARATNTFHRTLRKADDDRILRGITTRIPIYGNLWYESLPQHEEAGTMPHGLWQFRVFPIADPEAGFTLEAEYGADGWRALNLPSGIWAPEHREFTLRFFRSADDDNRPAVEIDGKRRPVGDPLTGPVHVAVNRWFQSGDRLDPPKPELHEIRDANLIHEFFESAATDWNWTEGSFRMAARWACQAEWNFMACASPGTPFMSSKTTFHGDQEHDYHMTIRPCQPWDAGDEDWIYTRSQFDKAQGWYNRHNLNFSFCADPRDPMSGYSVVFAGHDNEQTLLLRRGEVIAATSDPQFLMPSKSGFGSVHWKWWHFYVRKHGQRILVDCNDRPLFDVVDPDPLPGGHIGFWTIRNGFVVSRITSTAATLKRAPHARYVPEQAPPDFWRPLLRDAISVQPGDAGNSQRFIMLAGGGFQAVRHVFAEPIDLAETPLMNLGLTTSATGLVNLHLQIDGEPWLIRVNAPLEETKRILIPNGETDTEQFRIPAMSKRQIQSRLLASVAPGNINVNLKVLLDAAGFRGAPSLEAITIGNSSNQGYLLAGARGNNAGDWYEATPVRFTRQTEIASPR